MGPLNFIATSDRIIGVPFKSLGPKSHVEKPYQKNTGPFGPYLLRYRAGTTLCTISRGGKEFYIFSKKSKHFTFNITKKARIFEKI